MTTLGVKEAKDLVEGCFSGVAHREGAPIINLIKMLRAESSRAFEAGRAAERENPTTHGDEWEKGYARGQEEMSASYEHNFEYRAQQYMAKQIGHYVSMRRLFQDHGIDRD